MDDKKKMADELLEWIAADKNENYEIIEHEQENQKILELKTEYASGWASVCFLEFTIVEYRIVDLTGETVFYLHFELNDVEHAKELFREMKEALLKVRGNETINALLCCTCGLTTSYFTMKLNESAEQMGLKMHFDAVPYEKLYEAAADKDIVLIAPQIGYQLKNAQQILGEDKVMMIPVQIFSNYDVLGMLELVRKKAGEKTEKKIDEEKSDISQLADASGSLLVVSIIDMERRTQVAYRLYDDDEVTLKNQIVKRRYRFSDIEDTITLITASNPGIDAICLVTPGSISNGKLTYEKAGIIDLPVKENLEKKYNCKVILMNIADAIALGYSHLEREDRNTAFYFLPTGSFAGNFGLAENKHISGTSHLLGGDQLSAISTITTFPQNPYTLMNTPEGNIDLAARFMTGMITYTGCECIAYYAKMIPDTEALKNAIAKFIRPEYLPELIKVDSIRDYLYDGARLFAGKK